MPLDRGGCANPPLPNVWLWLKIFEGFALVSLGSFGRSLTGFWFSKAETMAFFVKNMISNQVKNLGFGGGSEEKKEEGGTSDPAAAKGMTREEYEEYQKQMIEEK